MASIFTELDLLRTENKALKQEIAELNLKLEKYKYYKSKCSHLKAKLKKLRSNK